MFCTLNQSPSLETQSPPTDITRPIAVQETAIAMDTQMMVNLLDAVQDFSSPCSIPKSSSEIMTSMSASATSSSGKETEGNGDRKKKRKFAKYFKRLMKEVLERQEKMQKMFMEALEKQDRDSIVREEIWRGQELARLKKEREMWEQEREVSEARDANLVALLQKISDQGIRFQVPEILLTPTSNAKIGVKLEKENANNLAQASYSRWPNNEIEALIRIKTDLDMKYQDTAPKGPLWEEVSILMRGMGYNKNAKRCKEKWENINKYFRRVRESNKRRVDDSKACSYFNLLESIYDKKQKKIGDSGDLIVKPEDILMQLHQEQHERIASVWRDYDDSENVGRNREDADAIAPGAARED